MTLAHVTRAGQEQQIAWIAGSVHRIVLDANATDGRLTAFRSTMRAGVASPVHVHEREDETVFLLSGTGTFWSGENRWELSSGDTAFLPRGLPHSYVFTSEEAELLTICNPSGMEDFFRAAGWDLSQPKPEDWAVDIKSLAKIGEGLGQTVLGPPLAPDAQMPAEYLTPASRPERGTSLY
ncbi:cupin domain-containing protein [Catenulispora sp. NL8]|uniref:Cupin domain-containing protein n=1 Tax=Catenulispora pinistramenti TaxID=2705254 RepID=A0ABS5KGS1_9ACTN|nr:cupin domain-containing protein [Catenulispora pinistramenti]MBS2545278.1 cupin domain-containing protein [Catenulispora pinistramenti]